ncbi:MAG: hypothetical protein KC535_01680 [Nanoarchaeota archaeon]|nr:hypothetical protein [Nanoarchaeota archaeon]
MPSKQKKIHFNELDTVKDSDGKTLFDRAVYEMIVKSQKKIDYLQEGMLSLFNQNIAHQNSIAHLKKTHNKEIKGLNQSLYVRGNKAYHLERENEKLKNDLESSQSKTVPLSTYSLALDQRDKYLAALQTLKNNFPDVAKTLDDIVGPLPEVSPLIAQEKEEHSAKPKKLSYASLLSKIQTHLEDGMPPSKNKSYHSFLDQYGITFVKPHIPSRLPSVAEQGETIKLDSSHVKSIDAQTLGVYFNDQETLGVIISGDSLDNNEYMQRLAQDGKRIIHSSVISEIKNAIASKFYPDARNLIEQFNLFDAAKPHVIDLAKSPQAKRAFSSLYSELK